MASQYIKLPVEDGGAPGTVDSFNGRTGVVVPASGDYTASQITNVPAGSIAATDVQAALNELDTEKQPALMPTTSKTANYTILATDSVIFCSTSGGAFSLTLPNPTTVTGKEFRIIDTVGLFNTNAVTLVRFGSEQISGLAASRLLQTDWGYYRVISNGTNWYVG